MRSPGGLTMNSYAGSAVEKYLSDAASDRPAPGGGSVSALVGALGCAMGEMAANFTVGRDKFAAVQEDVRESLGRLEAARERLTALMDDDVKAYNEVVRAQGLPGATQDEKESRKQQLGSALKGAMRVPLDIMRQCVTVCREAETLAEKANPYLITDAGVCAIMAEAACRGARLNVEINLVYIREPELEADVRREVRRMCESAASISARVEKRVRESLGG